MAKFNKNTNLKRYVLFVASLASFVAVPAMAAVLVQNFMTYDLVVDEPPIRKDQGADADLDGDGDDSTGYLQVDLGTTISNDDSSTNGGTDTLLSNEQITFTCFSGDRVYYTDVIQLVNTTNAAESTAQTWDVNLIIEPQLDSGGTGDDISQSTMTGDEDADFWVYASEIDTTAAATNERPNPNAAALDDWYDTADDTAEVAPNTPATVDAEPLQVEIVDGTASVLVSETGKFPIPTGEQRQVGIVADCSPEMASGDTITFNITVEATPTGQADF